MKQTVFFGPFIGEFGWEILWWQGWVKDLCRSVYKDHHKIVASFPGRYAFYPDADEFWGHPDSFCQTPMSQRAYFADLWRNGYPLGNVWRKRFKYFIRPVLESVPVRPEGEWPEAEKVAHGLLAHYRERLPEGAECVVPFGLTTCPKYGIKVGMEVREPGTRDADFIAHRPEIAQQTLERIQATARGVEYFVAKFGEGPLICVLPRLRSMRRPDKNWPKERYDELVRALQARHLGHRVALLGDPRGAHYAHGVPAGCLDLINVEDDVRMDVQVAALNRATVAVGGMSGGMLFALYAGCPSLIIGFADERDAYFDANHLGTRLVYYDDMDASVEAVAALTDGMMRGAIPPGDQRAWNADRYFGVTGVLRGRARRFLTG